MTETFSPLGKPIHALTTPALIVDAEALDQNLNLMAGYFAGRACKVRPHFKSHKCVTLSRRQLAAGNAAGITCAKLSEAEVLVAGGVPDVLIANQVVGPEKARRLAELNRNALVRVAVDSAPNAEELGQAATAAGVTIGVLVEVDIGMKRCGAPAGPPALSLARLVRETAGLRLDGLQGYEGHVVTLPDLAERRWKTLEAMEILVATRRALEAQGLPCPIVSGGGTGTYDITGNVAGVTEVQAGSYALMDYYYKKARPEFRCALNILATVISSSGSMVVLDVGLKGAGSDFGPPVVAGAPQARTLSISEEHLRIDNLPAPVGEKVRLIPSHGCTTCNLHRRMWIVRNGLIEAVWLIEGSGCLE